MTKHASATLAVFCDEREHETVSSFSDHFLGVYINRILCFSFLNISCGFVFFLILNSVILNCPLSCEFNKSFSQDMAFASSCL